MTSAFHISVSFKGQIHLIVATTTSTVAQIYADALEACNLQDVTSAIKIIYKGKKLNASDISTSLFPNKAPSKTPKLMVMASSRSAVNEIQDKKSDPTIRGFDQEQARLDKTLASSNNSVWGSVGGQDKHYRFVKIKACNDQDFGHPSSNTQIPHSFAAQQLLEQMANDPGVVAIMKERKLVVNTLEELDPIEDRIMQKNQHGGSALLGYNTNRGLSIHVRLRAFDLTQGFLPYPQLVSTLIHELSHNWVGDHDLLFWGNFGQMRVEYLHTHARLQGTLVHGKTTAAIAGISQQCRQGMTGIAQAVLQELATELPQYGLTPQPLAPAIVDRCRELTQQYNNNNNNNNNNNKKKRRLLNKVDNQACCLRSELLPNR